ncbi:hypothetical protein [Metapseudomonas otitidis]|uniref:hypothetical protein n=1 Tax=Metapseudomonas otitidis TaxID=319939 RepID=UPI0024494E79|nr:hypothetical protein [Pseudomonas otitidis]MDH0337556.1 hypothetical protein [Pseudomonas otitidis]
MADIEIDPRPLVVLTSALRASLAAFNSAARELQRLGVRIAAFHPVENRLEVGPADGRWLLEQRLIDGGFHRHPSAGSTRYSVLFRGVTLEWREPISYRDTMH